MPGFWSSTHKRALKKICTSYQSRKQHNTQTHYHMHSSNKVAQAHCVWHIKWHQHCFMWVFFYFNGWVLLLTTVRTWLLASGNDSDLFLVAHCSGDHYTPKPQLLYPHGHQQSTQLQHEYFTCASHVPPPPILYLHPNPSILIMVWHHLHAQVTICFTDTRPNLASHNFTKTKMSVKHISPYSIL